MADSAPRSEAAPRAEGTPPLRHNPAPSLPPQDNETLRAILAISTLSWVLMLLSNLRYGFGRRSPWDGGHQDDVGFTPFTANALLVLMYWVIGAVAQGTFLAQFIAVTPKQLTWHFTGSNLLLLVWSYLFARGHYVLAEVVIIVNFLQLAWAYLFARSYAFRPLPHWLAIHGALVVFPLVWSFYLIFWNGAVMFGARNIVPRLLANILIWLFLVIPGFFVLLVGDWILGLATAWIALAIGFGQLFTKVFALQWIFAFVISGILFVLSLSLAFVKPPFAETSITYFEVDSDQAPLLTDA